MPYQRKTRDEYQVHQQWNGQWEEVAARASCFFSYHSTQDRSVFDSDHHRATRLSGDTAGFQSDCLATILECFSYWIHFNSPFLNMTAGRSHERPGRGIAYRRRPSRLIRSL